jgi:post-segregation antitoxin (ccd killing protein)
LKITPAAGIIINMVLELKVDLSDALAREAKDRGLLEPAAVERMLQAELKRSRVDQLFAAADRLAAQTSPSLSEAEVEEEIQAARAQRRTADASRR